MKVVLVSFYGQPKELFSAPLLPLPLLYLGTYLKENNYEVILQDIDLNDNIEHYVNQTLSYDPILVGISARFGLYTDYYIKYSRMIKKANPYIPIVWGGCSCKRYL
jgi:hypothetical protein